MRTTPAVRRASVLLALLTFWAPLDVSAARRAAPGAAESPVVAAALASGFRESLVWSGFQEPTAIRFAADGRVFVIEKSGAIKVFASLDDPTPTTNTSLNSKVFSFWDRGMLGLALDPKLTGGSGTGDYIYVGYTYDHILGSTTPAPRWNDNCPTPPGPTTDGCVASSRLSRLPVNGTTIGAEQVLVEGWCQQAPSHSFGSIVFGPDGSLYASHGEAGMYFSPDYGQRGGSTNPIVTPKNPCGDPGGSSPTPPSAEGGALRSQDMRTAGDPVGLDGSVIRIDPATGAGVAGSPFAGSADANARRIIAYGLRNPFRMTFRPGTSELWVNDVGWNSVEEIDLIPNASDNVAENFGWPCYEGVAREEAWDALDLAICENLYAAGPSAVTRSFHEYPQGAAVAAGDNCPNGSSAITGLAYYPASGGSFPARYQNGLFFSDHTRQCIWFMPVGAGGRPDKTKIEIFYQGARRPVDLVVGPAGDLFYVDFDGGAVRRISPTPADEPPIAVIEATPTYGPTPLQVSFDATSSSDAEGEALAYAWDLDGDGQFDDGTGSTASRTYTDAGNVTAALRVTDAADQTDVATQLIGAGNTPPVPAISTPATTVRWGVGQPITFSGSASDTQDGALSGTSLVWTARLVHCPSTCHTHPTFFTTDGPSGTLFAPDHDYPSSIDLTLAATDSAGTRVVVTRRIEPKTVALTFKTSTPGLQLSVDSSTSVTPFTRTVIAGSITSVSAPTPQTLDVRTFDYAGWSDHGPRSHDLVAPSTNATYTANFNVRQVLVPAAVDAQVRYLSPTTNYGSGTALRVQYSRSKVYLKFTVTGLTAPPKGARLRLWVTEGSTAGGRIYRVSNSWTESGITWRNAPAIGTTSVGSIAAPKTGTWIEVPITNVVTANGTYSFAISGGANDSVDYASTETTRDPVLILYK